ncbi:carboxymuconolactone decarboxylase family protein [Campylobacter sp. LR185c]|uniref:carboxymuconolactone decarboxylase family protein n=1 Tax=Campylobacter sp. LR185c TaxID=2014525 RepID=UPI001CC26DDF|nr:carboxymuconolactone decarboxylase family protein [Campylobacter sp. LR185c]
MKRRNFLKKSVILTALLMSFNTLLLAKEKEMKFTKTAQKNFDKLFSNTKSPLIDLAQSDTEYFENYVNFAFDETLRASNLELKEYLLISLACFVSIPALSEFKITLRAALNNGVNPVAIKEMIYQASAYVGMPKVLDFINATNEIYKEFNIALPLKEQGRVKYNERFEKGLSVQKKIFGDIIDKANDETPKDYKHIRTFLSANCFGDYYTRQGLDLQFRELLTFVYLISMGGAQEQVKGHVRGNLNMDNDRQRLINVVTALIPYIGYPRSLNAINAIDEISLKA